MKLRGESEPSGGRAMLNVMGLPCNPIERSLRVLSYNCLADCNTNRVPHATRAILSWSTRREQLLDEIFSVRPDILCLQDVDSYASFWRPKLSSAGYDTIYKQRTGALFPRHEGVMVGWRRDIFKPMRSESMELNRLAENEEGSTLKGHAAVADNVALMVLLRPWEGQGRGLRNSLCVVCTQLVDKAAMVSRDGKGNSDDHNKLLLLQARGLMRGLEAFNGDFNSPVLLCGTFNCMPDSLVYDVIRVGVRRPAAAPPPAPATPFAEPLSSASVRLSWTAPPTPLGESAMWPVLGYNIALCAGGNRFTGFTDAGKVTEGDSIVYEWHTADTLKAKQLAEAKAGGGVSLQGSKAGDQLEEGYREGWVWPADEDENAQWGSRSIATEARETIVTGLSGGIAYEFKVAAVNGLGRGDWSLPSAPVRTPVLGANEPEDKVLLSTASIKLIRERQRAAVAVSEGHENPREHGIRKFVKIVGCGDIKEEMGHDLATLSGLTPRYVDGSLNTSQTTVKTPSDLLHLRSRVTAQRRLSAVATGSLGPRDGEISLDEDFSKVRLQRDKIEGERSDKHEHSLGLCSAYEKYWAGGEPLYTTSTERMWGTVDYIFHTGDALVATRVLSIPELEDLEGWGGQESLLIPDIELSTPADWCDDPSNDNEYEGEWAPYLEESSKGRHRWLPNKAYPSDHLMLSIDLLVNEEACCGN